MVHAIDVSLNVSEAWIINNLKALILIPIFDFHFLDNSATSDDFNCVRHYLCLVADEEPWAR